MDSTGQFSLSATPPSTGGDEAPLLCLHDFEVRPLNAEGSLLVSRVTGKTYPVANFLIGPLQQLRTAQTLEAHLQQMLPLVAEKASKAALTELIRKLQDVGLVYSSEQLKAQFEQHDSGATESPAASRLFISSSRTSSGA